MASTVASAHFELPTASRAGAFLGNLRARMAERRARRVELRFARDLLDSGDSEMMDLAREVLSGRPLAEVFPEAHRALRHR
jgi:hypothetical protein